MRLPNRKYPQTKKQEFDPYITEEKYQGLKTKLEKLEKVDRLQVAKEVAELALDGDFSENAGYQAAKHNLRTKAVNQHAHNNSGRNGHCHIKNQENFCLLIR